VNFTVAPQVTLAAVADAAPPLQLPQLVALQDLCLAHAAILPACCDAEIIVDTLSAVQFDARRCHPPSDPSIFAGCVLCCAAH
jgi:hypothetical protein